MPFRTVLPEVAPPLPVAHLVLTAADGHDHLVTESALASSPDGRFPARCGRLVVGAAMSTPPSDPCALCGRA